MERNRKSFNSDEIGFCLAKALFANESETSDELCFSRGDILTVLEQNPSGLEGWWLCSLRGRQGIAPANRLRLIPGVFDKTGLGNGFSSLSQLNANHNNSNNNLCTRRKSWNCQNRVMAPQKVGDGYLYTSSSNSELLSSNEYDIPIASKSTSSLENVTQTRQRTPSQTSYDFPQQSVRQVLKATDQEAQRSKEEPLTLDTVIKAPNSAIASSSNALSVYDIPSSKHHLVNELMLPFESSSGSSNSSSLQSPSSNRSSLDASLSLSSFGGSNRSSLEKHSNDNFYDIPPEPRKLEESSNEEQVNDENVNLLMVPPPPPQPSKNQTIINSSILQFYDIPSNKPFVEKSLDSLSRSPPSYDFPKPNSIQKEINSEQRDQNYSPLPVVQSNYSLDEAQIILNKLQTKCQSAINDLFHHFVTGTNWRVRHNLSGRVKDLQNSCYNLRDCLNSFVLFGFESYSNASVNSTDKALINKLLKLVKQLRVSSDIVEKATKAIDEKGLWTLDKISINESDLKKGLKVKLDELDQLVACARGLQEDVKHISSFISGNVKLIFPEVNKNNKTNSNNSSNNNNNLGKPPIAPKPNKFIQQKELPKLPPKYDNCPKLPPNQRPLPPLPKSNELTRETMESPDYEDCPDYVSLESKEFIEKQNEKIKEILPKDLRKSYENLLKDSEIPVENLDMGLGNIRESEYGKLYEGQNSLDSCLNQNKINSTDQQILHFYGKEMEKHSLFLSNSIEAFVHTIHRQQPPKIFINHSKFVVIAAQKLVYIAGSLQRNLKATDVKNEIIKSSNSLCDSLKTLVLNTKKAAINFPSVQSVQEMLDSLVEVSFNCNHLKQIITKSYNI